MAQIDPLFHLLLEQNGSDLHLSQGQPPKMRIHGRMLPVEGRPVLTEGTLRQYLQEICPPHRWEQFMERRDLDFAYALGETARFRTNYYFQARGLAAVFRLIPAEINTLDELNLPKVLKSFAFLRSGLVLVTGPTGSGKSTTLAAILNEINTHRACHIVTIEEPIEFVHRNRQSIFCQREVGVDADSFADALRTVLRQDSDVILVGEMRDKETIALAITAASMGMLIFATLHTNSAVKSVDRIIDVFSADEQPQIRTMLADSLKGVCAQLLLQTKDGRGRLAANEILLPDMALPVTIRDNKTPNIRNIIQAGGKRGMQLMDDAIFRFYQEGRISGRSAYLNALDKTRFREFAPDAGRGSD
ncbi:MAG: PilT/PilU family type 4a pilus ATPase [Planctomycetota bacterium]